MPSRRVEVFRCTFEVQLQARLLSQPDVNTSAVIEIATVGPTIKCHVSNWVPIVPVGTYLWVVARPHRINDDIVTIAEVKISGQYSDEHYDAWHRVQAAQ